MAAGTERVTIPYHPRPLQRTIHERLQRFSVLVCHRRFGKTVLGLNEIIKRACENKRKAPRYAYIAPLYSQAKRIAWDYLREFAGPIPGRTFHESELRCDLPWGARIQLLGAENPDSLRGIYLDGAVLDEYAQMRPSVWTEIVRPALSDREGWALFIGTPRGRNHFHELYQHAVADPGWFASVYAAGDTQIIPDAELTAARSVMDPSEYEQEFECSFSAALVGAYYGRDMDLAHREGRIRSVPWERDLPVHTAWDLGIGDSTAIWFVQLVGREIRVIDYEEHHGVGLDHYAKRLQERPYVYGDHVYPHDVEVSELGTGRTRLETLQSLGLPGLVVPRIGVDDGINAVRSILPRCYFDAEKCERGLEALRSYRREWDERGQMFKPKPVHDWASHGADALRYLALSIDRLSADVSEMPRHAITEYDPFRPAIEWQQAAHNEYDPFRGAA